VIDDSRLSLQAIQPTGWHTSSAISGRVPVGNGAKPSVPRLLPQRAHFDFVWH